MRGKSRSNSVEEITLQVPSLDPRFAIFIDLHLYTLLWQNNKLTKKNMFSCDFQAAELKLHSAATGEFVLFLLV